MNEENWPLCGVHHRPMLPIKCSTLTSGLSVWLVLGGGGSLKHLAPRSGKSPLLMR